MRPISAKLQGAINNYSKGNFGLYFNKFIEINNNDFKPNNNNHYENLINRYNNIKYGRFLSIRLDGKHNNQKDYLTFYENKSKTHEIEAKLISPLIVGIGETNPSEVGMVFDRTLGIPYIPASSIKGVVRFAYIIDNLFDNNGELKQQYKDKKIIDDENDIPNIPKLFGTQDTRGKVVFLDAYPSTVPDLHIDIMNPHYGDYYKEGTVPPADYLTPVPIKFLTVAKGTRFVFRLIAPSQELLFDLAKKALIKALTEQGIGAKTAVGYGRFKIIQRENTTSNSQSNIINQQNIEKIKQENKNKEIESISKEINNITEETNNDELGTLLTKLYDNNYPKKIYQAFKDKLIEINKWNDEEDMKEKEMKRRKKRREKIEEKINKSN